MSDGVSVSSSSESDECSTSNRLASGIDGDQMGVSGEITEEILGLIEMKAPDLVLELPPRNSDHAEDNCDGINDLPAPSPTPKKVNFSPLPSPRIERFHSCPSLPVKEKPSFRNIIPRVTFKFRTVSKVIGSPSSSVRGRPSFSRAFPFSKLFSPRIKRHSSYPVMPISHSNPESLHGDSRKEFHLPVSRSHSVPDLLNDGSFKQLDSTGGVFRIIPTTPRVKNVQLTASTANTTVATDKKDGPVGGDGEDILEEEAVCRICYVELGEGCDTFKLECSCKGELALAHQDCIVKWFSIKGNKICDVCKQDVVNLPVTLLRIQANNRRRRRRAQQVDNPTSYRVCQDVPVLVIVSMLAYFCFLELMLVKRMGSGAIAISLPFSCILGLLASMTSTTIVRRLYAWIYAFIQFALVVLFSHLFYSVLHMHAVLSVLVATFVGFGGTMCGCSLILEVLRWRTSSLSTRIQQRQSTAELAQQQGILNSTHVAVNPEQTASSQHEIEIPDHNLLRGN